MVLYVPGTEETDPKKQNMSLQQIGAATSTNVTNIASNTTNISANTTAIAALQSGRVAAVRVQKFTASGTYTPSTGMLYCTVECQGAGGGGGGAALTGAGTQNASGGGGGGGYSRKFATAATIGASQTVTVGAAGTAGAAGNNAGGSGGDTSVGVICVGKGGSGGAGAASGANGTGGAGGIAGTGDVTIVGQPGSQGGLLTSSGAALFPLISGQGGNSVLGFGGPSATTANTPAAGAGFGGGGSGVSDNAGGNRAGAAGAPGVVVITEFCTQ